MVYTVKDLCQKYKDYKQKKLDAKKQAETDFEYMKWKKRNQLQRKEKQALEKAKIMQMQNDRSFEYQEMVEEQHQKKLEEEQKANMVPSEEEELKEEELDNTRFMLNPFVSPGN